MYKVISKTSFMNCFIVLNHLHFDSLDWSFGGSDFTFTYSREMPFNESFFFSKALSLGRTSTTFSVSFTHSGQINLTNFYSFFNVLKTTISLVLGSLQTAQVGNIAF